MGNLGEESFGMLKHELGEMFFKLICDFGELIVFSDGNFFLQHKIRW